MSGCERVVGIRLLCAVLLMWLATGVGDVALAGGGGGHGKAAAAEADAAEGAKIRGVELGDYYIRCHYPVQAQKSVIRFMLYTAVPSERYRDVQQVVESHRHKLRDLVITVTRLTPQPYFDEPDLKSFRRLMLMRLRRALPELNLDDVYVTDFQLVVQSL
jgi:hypothetical protein